MHYMIVNVHNAESCAFRGEEESRHLEGAFDRFADIAARHDISVAGSWVNRPSHEVFILVDAPGAHAVDDAIVECGLVGHTTTRVLSVVALDEATTPYTEQAVGAGAGHG